MRQATSIQTYQHDGRVAVALLAGLLLGTAWQLQLPRLWPPAALLACTASAALLLALGMRARGVWRAAGLGAGMLLVGFALAGWRAGEHAGQALPASLEGRDLVLTGWIAAMPQRLDGGQRFAFEVEQASLAGRPAPVRGTVLLGWWYGDGVAGPPEPSPALRAGDRWRLTVRLRAPHGTLNPHGFDQELSLWEQGVHATGSVRTGAGQAPPRHLGTSGRYLVERWRQGVRDAILARVADPARAGVLAALVVGDQRAIERADWDVFRATGVAHLMSISGLHVTMFAWLAAGLLRRAWQRSARLCLAVPAQHAAVIGGVLLAAAYALFSGWGVPAQRTVWMLATVGALRLSGLRWPWPLVWLLAACVVVVFDPWALLQAGFWLSFVAVGVLFASAPTGGAPSIVKGLWPRVGALLREQAVVTIALAPLTLLLFGQLSLVGLPANLVAIPAVTLLVTPLALAGIVLPPLWDVAGAVVALLNTGLVALAQVPGAVWSAATPPLTLALAALAGGVLLVLPAPAVLRAMGLPLLLPVLLWQPPRPAPGQFELLAADVGQGSAVLVRTAGHSLLYDTGPRYGGQSNAGHRVLVPLLRALGERPTRVMISHRDTDHSGGAAPVLAAHPQAQLWASFAMATDAPEATPERRPWVRCEAGQRWDWDGVRFEVLHPEAADYESARLRPNALSCVLRVSAGGRAALLTGDIERPQEQRLLARAAVADIALRADLLLVPHHGSRTSSTEAFIEAVGPKVALVQAGWRNRFGHPVPQVMARYEQRGIGTTTSAACGAALWSSAQPRHVSCERDRVRRYWHHDVEAAMATLAAETADASP
jgi:competence protein ComEC